MDLDDGGVHHGVFHVRRIRTGLEKLSENVGFNPVAVPLENSVPVAEERRKITPRASRPQDPEHRFVKPAVVATAAPGGPSAYPSNAAPSSPIGRLSVRIDPKLESQPSLRSNPDSQQSLGLVASIARPGDNITGVAIVGELKIIERRMGLLAEAMPKLSTIGYLASRPSWEDSRGAAVREAAKRAGHFVVACYAERF